jgi:hypothetical protein
VGSCEHGNELLCSIKRRKVVKQFSDYQLLKKVSVPQRVDDDDDDNNNNNTGHSTISNKGIFNRKSTNMVYYK